jgi:CheY-like chemotaxis protein
LEAREVVTEFDGREAWQPPDWSRRRDAFPADAGRPNAMAVMVVDDEESVRATVADVIRTVGYTVIEASDGADALRFLSTMWFNAIVLDLHMPRLDGATLLSSLRRPPPVVVLSGYEMEEESRRRFGRAIVTYLHKPVPPPILLDALSEAVGLQRQP